MPRVELVVPISESSTVLSLIKKILGFPALKGDFTR
jgi:hypothetical protein